MSGPSDAAPADVVGFWKAAGPDKWYKRDATFDAEIRSRFGALYDEAAAGQHADWADTPEGALALLLLLDQFSRNLFRESAKAFAQDARALEIAETAVAEGFVARVEEPMRQFFFTPHMHSESHPDQMRCIALAHRYGGADNLNFAHIHERIIRRFGRFPHRNPVLGRHMTPAEQQFLDGGGFGA